MYKNPVRMRTNPAVLSLSRTIVSLLSLALLVSVASAQTPPAEHPASREIHPPVRIQKRLFDGTSVSTNWSGFAVTGATGSVTDVKGSWIVPAVNCSVAPRTAYSSFWVGIDGYNSNTVEQTGTDSDCSRGTPVYYAWYEFYPAASVTIQSLAIHPGDVITAEVKYNSGTSFTLNLSVNGGTPFSLTQNVANADRSSAEWIAEAPSSVSGVLPLANFGSVLFGANSTGIANTCTATVGGSTGPIQSFGAAVDAITMASGGVTEATPSALSADGTSFAVDYGGSQSVVLSIAKSHSGNFTQGQTNAAYTLTVSNDPGASASSGVVTVTDTPPPGMTLVSMSGTGWSCSGNTCDRSNALAPGSSYPAITVLVNVAANAASPQVNQASVSGGGSATATASDSTTIDTTGTAITFQTSPSGLQFSVDGTLQVAPQTLNLTPGSHTIAVETPQAGSAGSQYVFTSWSDGGAVSHTINVGGSPATYTAAFKTQYQLAIAASPVAGGTVLPVSGTYYDSGTVVPISATPAASYSFTSWTGNVSNATNPSTTITMNAPQTVTANFSNLVGITFQTSPPGLRFSVDGQPAQIAPQTLGLAPGSHTITVTATQAGSTGTQFVFTAWSDGGAVTHQIAVGSSAATYTATFKTQYQLTISASPAPEGSVTPASGAYFDAGTAVPISATANSGYVFAGWTGSVASTFAASTTVTMSAPQAVVGNFALPTNITVQTGPPGLQFMVDGGSVQIAPSTLPLAPGPHTIAVIATQPGAARTQYVFANWNDGGAASHAITVGASPATYIATFKTQYQLSISASPVGGGTVTPATGQFYDSDAVVPINATAGAGYSFSSWTGGVADSSSASTSVTMFVAQTVVANFAPLANITIQTSPPGLQFTLDNGAPQVAPQTIALKQGLHSIAAASTQAGAAGVQYVFTGWSDGLAASHQIVVGSSAATYTASYKTQYQLTISASPAAGGSVTPASGAFYDSGTVVPVNATANSGYTFSNWTGNVSAANAASTTLTMSAPQTVTGNFAPQSGHPAFFTGEALLPNSIYYLQFPNATPFGYYAYLSGGFIYHFDMGYEYIFSDPNDPQHAAYLWDNKSGHWFYTSPALFPYLYDFTLSAWIYYLPDSANPGHYTTNPRQFAYTSNHQTFTM